MRLRFSQHYLVYENVYIENVVTTTPTTIIFNEDSSTINATIWWDLLAKIKIFGIPKTMLAQLGHFYAPCSGLISL
jgi:hypothetical protein